MKRTTARRSHRNELGVHNNRQSPLTNTTSTLTNTFIPLKFRADYPFYGRAAVEVIFWGTFMRPRSGQSDLFTSTFITSLSRVRASRRVVAIVLVEVAGTLLVVVLLPRGGVRSVEVLDLLAIILVEPEPVQRGRWQVGSRALDAGRALDATCAHAEVSCFETACVQQLDLFMAAVRGP